MMNGNANEQKNSVSRSTLLGAATAVMVLLLLLAAYMLLKPVPMEGSKAITIEVVYEDGSKDGYTCTTTAHFLKEALDAIPELTIEGTSTEDFGLMMITVNGIRADFQSDRAYWALLSNGTPSNYGISRQPVKDGELYQIVYTPSDQ